MIWNFEERLKFSQGKRGERDAAIIKKAIPNCVDVIKTDEATDKKGVDYIAILEGGAKIGIDVKARGKGCSRYWKNGQEDLMLEMWSVCPDENNKGKVGWTLSDKTNVDYILFTFDEADSNRYYLLPYQSLRMAFKTNERKWIAKYGFTQSTSTTEKSNRIWHSRAVFVPANEVLNAMAQEMQGKILMKEG